MLRPSSGVMVLWMSAEKAKALGLKPRARIVTSALTGTEPTIMLEGPAPATRKALQKAGLTVDDIDLFELNEAFAAQSVACMRPLNIAPEKTNVNGGAIALEHPDVRYTAIDLDPAGAGDGVSGCDGFLPWNGKITASLGFRKGNSEQLDAGIDPRTITYVETHGTGTKLGDPIEVKALTEAFRAEGWSGTSRY